VDSAADASAITSRRKIGGYMDTILNSLREIIVSLAFEDSKKGVIRLPSERVLAAKLGIQRSTLRERLAMLEQLGVLNRAQGSGTYVELPSSELFQFYFDLAVALGFVTLDELEVARELLEREIARRAAHVATEEDIAALEQLVTRMETAPNPNDCLEADYQFHWRLTQAARNPVITLIIEGLSHVLRRILHRRRYLTRSVKGSADRQNAIHWPIVEAIRNHNPEAALRAMDEHFRVWEEESSKVSELYAQDEKLPAPSS
jgi:GntR family transcriptional regulator, transcriptional repressor for pyruvate dehydrogenase complex